MHSTVKLTIETLWSELLERVPEFKPIFADDVAFNGEILSHGLFEALFRLMSKAHEDGDTNLFERVIAFINEAAMSEDEDVIGPVHISFMNRVSEFSLDEAVLPLLNPAARKVYDATNR